MSETHATTPMRSRAMALPARPCTNLDTYRNSSVHSSFCMLRLCAHPFQGSILLLLSKTGRIAGFQHSVYHCTAICTRPQLTRQISHPDSQSIFIAACYAEQSAASGYDYHHGPQPWKTLSTAAARPPLLLCAIRPAQSSASRSQAIR